ncbi:MAG: T9SS type A sorting domain-containing protein, partial [Chryseobacterium sp.]|nr:T9SS type A sorting domain-containing protein [Chryseobacterium sp.]
NFVKNTLVTENIYFGSEADVKIYNMNGQVVRTAKVSENNNMNVSDLQPGAYIVTGIVNGQPVSQKILKK